MGLTASKAVQKERSTLDLFDGIIIHYLRNTSHEKEKITKM